MGQFEIQTKNFTAADAEMRSGLAEKPQLSASPTRLFGVCGGESVLKLTYCQKKARPR
jgi:hypothetical protein